MESIPNWPLGIFRTKPIITGITLMVLALGIMIINKRFYILYFVTDISSPSKLQ